VAAAFQVAGDREQLCRLLTSVNIAAAARFATAVENSSLLGGSQLVGSMERNHHHHHRHFKVA